MDISRTLTAITQGLIKFEAINVNTSVYSPSKENFGYYNVVISIQTENDFFSGSSSDKNVFNAYIKALAELGEVRTFKELKMKTRTGLSGGFLKESIIQRAKMELLERDAFVFHYRNQIPFLELSVHKESKYFHERIAIFKMCSASNEFSTSLCLPLSCLEGKTDCLIFGLGSGLTPVDAGNKALSEMSSFYFRHILEPKWCQELSKRKETLSLADFHHLQSKDHRNLRRFIKLSNVSKNLKREFILPEEWKLEKIRSPLRFFNYFYVNHPKLLKMEFGVPEPDYEEPPLYHPFW